MPQVCSMLADRAQTLDLESMRAILDAILGRLITNGRLTVTWPDGSRSTYEGKEGPNASVQLRDQRTIRRLVLNPSLGAGEAYMSGSLTTDSGIYDFLDTMLLNMQVQPGGHPIARTRELLGKVSRRIAQYNPAGRARRNVA